MKALVFGGAGMLGRDVVIEGRRRGHATLGLARGQADVTDRERLLDWARSWEPDVVVNCAAFTAVDACEERRDHAHAVNGDGARHAAEAAREVGAPLLQVSTDYFFSGRVEDPDDPRPWDEDAPTEPASVYGASKRAGEEAALAAHGATTVVRTSWLFGPGGPNFVRTMVGLIEAGRTPLRVVDDQRGCPTWTPHLAAALWDLAALAAEPGGELPDVVHYRDREPVTWCGFARAIADLWDPRVEVVPVTTEEFPRPAPRPADSVLAVERFEGLVGRPVAPWRAGLAPYLNALAGGRA